MWYWYDPPMTRPSLSERSCMSLNLEVLPEIVGLQLEISWHDLTIVVFIERHTVISNYNYLTIRAIHLVPPFVKTISGYYCTDKIKSEVLNEITAKAP